MKKNILLICCLLCFGYASFAQDVFEFWTGDGSAKMPDTLVIDYEHEKDSMFVVKTYISFKNVSSEAIGIRMRGGEIGNWQEGEMFFVSYCHTLCVDSGEPTPAPGVVLEPGAIFISKNQDGENAAYITFEPGEPGYPAGNYYYRLTGFTADNVERDLIIKYEVRGTTNIKTPEKSTVKVDVYPNPASDNVKVKYDLGNAYSSDSQLVIRNLVGSVVKTIPLKSTEKEITASVSDLSSGIYFYSLSVDGAIQNTKKLIIKR